MNGAGFGFTRPHIWTRVRHKGELANINLHEGSYDQALGERADVALLQQPLHILKYNSDSLPLLEGHKRFEAELLQWNFLDVVQPAQHTSAAKKSDCHAFIDARMHAKWTAIRATMLHAGQANDSSIQELSSLQHCLSNALICFAGRKMSCID